MEKVGLITWRAQVMFSGSPEWKLRGGFPGRHGFTRTQALRRIHRLCDRNDAAPARVIGTVYYGGEDV
ncbi:hypothetical protein [Streptosporangium sp. NPDC002524]|uniref:hypothetical protein n=1 Tax=Streptosporangium sp. NPDC002524 TaxID=3154537 RepID=UPI00332D1151